MRLLAIGGSDAGISAALRARELDPSADVTVVVADAYPNFSICGIPYYVSGEVTHWRNLAHRTLDDLEATGMTLRLDTTVTRIDHLAHSWRGRHSADEDRFGRGPRGAGLVGGDGSTGQGTRARSHRRVLVVSALGRSRGVLPITSRPAPRSWATARMTGAGSPATRIVFAFEPRAHTTRRACSETGLASGSSSCREARLPLAATNSRGVCVWGHASPSQPIRRGGLHSSADRERGGDRTLARSSYR
jgi:hypothetical protein